MPEKMEIEVLENMDELELTSHFQLQEAISSLKFHWNLAIQKGQTITMVILGKPTLKGGRKMASFKKNGGDSISV